ncbi:MAG: NTP transferase domain-containing protein [Bacteroidota bacterium]
MTIENTMNTVPAIYGLVLSGGKSTRMGSDKGALTYYDVPQREYCYTMLAQLCDRVFLSLRKDQQQEIPNTLERVIDVETFRGPFNGILSAHKRFPDKAWLVVACDLPLLDVNTLKILLRERDPNRYATAMATRNTKLPEPLVAIWEPKALAGAMGYLQSAEGSSPRKYLVTSDTKLVYPSEDQFLYNANSQEEYHFAKSQLK